MSRDEKQPTRSFGMQRQIDIYLAGAQGKRPEQPTRIDRLRRAAKRALPPEAWGYLEGGAGCEDTMRANRDAFRRWRIVPRMLRGVSQPDLAVELYGRSLRAPLLLAPLGVQSILHAEAEVAAARAAAALAVPIVLSTASSKPLEEVAQAAGGTLRWFQLYWSKSREFTASLLGRAERAGYSAIVVTLDTFQLGWRPRDLERAYLPFLLGEGLGNYVTDPVFLGGLARPPRDDIRPAAQRFAEWFCDPTLTWDDLSFLREHTRLPILLKGIEAPDDARRAIDHGMDGIVVSNHGGRQVDGAIGALDALPGVVEVVDCRFPVLFDSGVRCAADVFKAMALGASAVLIGRPYAYGLAVRGEAGVRDVLHDLLAELDLTLALSGCRSFAEVRQDNLAEVSVRCLR